MDVNINHTPHQQEWESFYVVKGRPVGNHSLTQVLQLYWYGIPHIDKLLD